MTTTLLIILNLIVIESLLSLDNAAVLAVMVKDLPDKQKTKALRYGLLGAYVFRGACLLLASFLVKILWLKILGGLYLVYLVYGHFTKANDTIEEASETNDSKIYKWAMNIGINRFWSTVILVEIMDLAFSIDNIFAAVALSNNFYIVMAGVAIGILAMRFVAGWFVKMIEKYPSLENSAFVVIALLGLKLIISGTVDYIPTLQSVSLILQHHLFDMIFSSVMMFIFFIPIILKTKMKKIVPALILFCLPMLSQAQTKQKNQPTLEQKTIPKAKPILDSVIVITLNISVEQYQTLAKINQYLSTTDCSAKDVVLFQQILQTQATAKKEPKQ